jgi:hypothetical protein
MRYLLLPAALLAGLFSSCSPAGSSGSAEPATITGFPDWQMLDGNSFANWTGLKVEGAHAVVALPGEMTFRYPDGPKGWIKHGFRITNDGAADWHDAMGVALDIDLPDDQPMQLDAYLGTPGQTDPAGMVRGHATLSGAGWHHVTLPWSAFAFDQANSGFLQNIKELRLDLQSPQATAGSAAWVKNVRVIDGDPLAIRAAIRGKSADAGQGVSYDVTVSNCSGVPQTVDLSILKHGWETMPATVEPASLTLAPAETKTCTVQVNIPERVAPGGHEVQVVQAIAEGRGEQAATLPLFTARALAHPYILRTPAQWQAIRDKVKSYPWAAAEEKTTLAAADKWTVPEIAQPPHNDPDDTMGPFLFPTGNESGLMACGISWQLTRDKKYAEKVATFLRRLSDPANGYAKTFRGSNQGFVQEGHFFQHIALAYDMIGDSGVLSAADTAQIDAALRLALQTFDLGNQGGAINNWNLSEMTGAFFCSLAVQDMERANRFFAGSAGIRDQLGKGVMDDGWWYECSVSYNTWCASEFTQDALAGSLWGFDFTDAQVPASYYKDASLSSASGKAQVSGGSTPGTINEQDRPFGMCKEIWGPDTRPYRQIRDMWSSLPPFLDWRGVMFGINDTTEKRPANQDDAFDMAYQVYHDPTYAGAALKATHRSLLYGEPVLPQPTADLSSRSAYADNAGVVMLRSQTPARPQSDQIQAVLHYGTHGWAHGHFDRTDLLSLMRYGRSFYNPEMLWYSYEPFMYKFYVQTSVNHNMVVVDQKMQEPVESQRLLFYTGRAFQATAVQTDCRWSNPPYGGMVYDYVPVKTFAEKCWREGRDVPVPAHPPVYGSLTDYTEPILQRRLMVVTDDYVVVADYLKAAQKHTFDDVLQLTGFKGLDASGKTFLRHDAQWSTDPVSSAQFVTDCDWYSAQAPSVAHASMYWKSNTDPAKVVAPTLCSEDGTLNLDVHSLWPAQQQIMVGQSPEDENNQKKLWYTVTGDGKVLAQGRFGSWILGQAAIDVPVAGLQQLDLETKVEDAKKNTLFWGNAHVVTKDGREIPLAQLPVKFENVVQPPAPGKDYYGGPIKIVGMPYTGAVPAEPQDQKQSGVVHVDLRGVAAARFVANLGGSFPLGNAGQLHKVYSLRTTGTQARFLTLIEPYDKQALVKTAQADGPDHLHVELTDGRVQDITLAGMESDGHDLTVSLVETKNGHETRRETNTVAAQP